MSSKISIGVIRVACKNSQKDAIRYRFKSSYNNTKKEMLEYKDNCCFRGCDVKQSTYKNLTQFLNRQAGKGALIKVHRGSGYLALYSFPHDELEILIDEVIEENKVEEFMVKL